MNEPISYRKDELTLREMIDSWAFYKKYVIRYAKYVILLGILMGLASVIYFKNKEEIYHANMTFMLNEDETSSLGNISSIIGQIGLPILNKRVNISKILELSKSRTIIQDAIFKMVNFESKETYLANAIIEKYELCDGWKEVYPEMENFKFAHHDVERFNLFENFALKSLSYLIGGSPAKRKNALLQTDFSQNTTIMAYDVRTIDEMISFYLTTNIFESTSKFYSEKAIERQSKTLGVLLTKRDSVKNEYFKLENRFASLSDRAGNLFAKKEEVKLERTKNEMRQMGGALTKLEENIALVQFNLESSTPILQILDRPILPLPVEKMSTISAFTYGFLAGIFAATSILILWIVFFQGSSLTLS